MSRHNPDTDEAFFLESCHQMGLTDCIRGNVLLELLKERKEKTPTIVDEWEFVDYEAKVRVSRVCTDLIQDMERPRTKGGATDCVIHVTDGYVDNSRAHVDIFDSVYVVLWEPQARTPECDRSFIFIERPYEETVISAYELNLAYAGIADEGNYNGRDLGFDEVPAVFECRSCGRSVKWRDVPRAFDDAHEIPFRTRTEMMRMRECGCTVHSFVRIKDEPFERVTPQWSQPTLKR